jgi:NADPH:quinone reductase-like Zn-dependent oxidoreductase
MQAVMQDGYGSADVFRLAQINTPEIADNQVLVRVRAAGLDRGTWHLMVGRPYLLRLALGFRKPKTPVPGRDLAGTVVAVGSAVTKFSPGEEVYGTGNGSFAQYVAAPEDQLARKPVNLSFQQAAVVPVSALTALQALTDVGRLQPGQQVLIIGALAAWAATPYSWPRLSEPRSPASAAPRNSILCDPWVPIMSSTTPERTSPMGRTATA